MPRIISAVLLTLFSTAAGAADRPEAVADAVTLRDGSVVLGELIEPGPRGEATMYVRREWARKHVPPWADRWEHAESGPLKRAIAQRKTRLTTWKAQRAAAPAAEGDRITPWLDKEIERLGKLPRGEGPEDVLMVVKLPALDVKSIARRPKADKRLLRLGWGSGFRGPETMKADDLTLALEGRGFDLSEKDPVPLDALLPIPVETEPVWLSRRAATEVLNDPGLRFVRYEGLVMPEPAPGQALDGAAATAAFSALKSLLDDKPEDPLPARLREVATKGRSAALVTQLDMGADLSTATVTMTLWVRPGAAVDRWQAAGSRSATVSSDKVAPDAGKGLADDPQVKMLFQVADGLGLGAAAGELKQQSLKMGAATQQALGQARKAAEADLATLALPVKPVGRDKDKNPAEAKP